ncbi:MAG: acyltransferase [Phormidesmis sp.]
MQRDRIPELDLLRGVAIICVLLAHTPDYIGDHPWFEYGKHGFILIGLGAFAFLTGYGLENTRLRKGGLQIKSYIQRRFWRMYVPYLVTLVIFLGVFGALKINRSLPFSILSVTTVVHALGLQVLLYPKFRSIFTLWYVGLLLPMYAIYPLIVRKETTAYLVRCLVLILLVTLAIRYGFNTIDIRFFGYFPAFIGGIIIRRTRTLPFLLKGRWGLLALVSFVGLYMLHMQLWGGAVIYDRWQGENTAENTGYFVLPILKTYLLMALSLIAILCFLRFVVQTKQLHWVAKVLGYIASGAYFTYLIHRPVLAFFAWVTVDKLSLPSSLITLLFLPVVAGIIAVCHITEKAYAKRLIAQPKSG